jgi:pseudouridine-5'-phosphate glycosidase
VVALETTLVAHGFPGGVGADVAAEAERRVRVAWAVPATVGVIDGRICVGMEEGDLERFASAPEARKVGPRDLAACAVKKELGATTVGATLAVCRAAGIGFMGTGGIGGVHRGFAETLDVSADLGELARTEALVVSSGAKSILDVAATAEVLETLGVPVLGWRTDEIPLFYRAGGGPPVSQRVQSAEEAAQMAQFHWRLGRHSGIVLARPPDESLDVEPLIEEGLAEANQRGIRGQALTPFVLSYLHEKSDGRTIELNKRLIAENAGLAAEIAVAYSKRREVVFGASRCASRPRGRVRRRLATRNRGAGGDQDGGRDPLDESGSSHDGTPAHADGTQAAFGPPGFHRRLRRLAEAEPETDSAEAVGRCTQREEERVRLEEAPSER